MASDVDNVLGGPGYVTLGGNSIGHTQGGITANITPKNRPVNVDQFGVSEVNYRHTGDESRMTIPFAEWSAATIAEIYDGGNDQTGGSGAAYLGIGRSAGKVYDTQASEIIAFLTADAAKKLSFHRSTPIGGFDIAYKTDEDRIFNIEFANLVDESQTDGELIGKVEISAA